MFKIILFLLTVVQLHAFLLDGRTIGPTASGTHYLTFDDKIQLLNDIQKVHKEQKDLLALLSSQVQQRFLEIEKEVKEQKNSSEKYVSLNQFIELQNTNTDLRLSLEKLQNDSSTDAIRMKAKISELENEIYRLRQLNNTNQTVEKIKESLHSVDTSVNMLMSHEQARNQDFLALYNITKEGKTEFENFKRQTVSTINAQNMSIVDLSFQTKKEINTLNSSLIMQLKNVNESFGEMEGRFHSVDTSVNLLMTHDKYQNQKLLVLSNITTKTQSELDILKRETASRIYEQNRSITNLSIQSKNGLNTLNSTLINRIDNGIHALNIKLNNQIQTGLQKVTALQKSSSAALQTQIDKSQKKVSYSGCIAVSGTYPTGSTLPFDQVKHKEGINFFTSFYLDTQKKIMYMEAGLYLISVTIMSNTSGAAVWIFKNNYKLRHLYVTSNRRNEAYTGTAVITTDLQSSDTIYVTTDLDMYIYNSYSCLTIVKLK